MLTAHDHDMPTPLADDETLPSVWTPVVPDEPVASREPASALVSPEQVAPSSPPSRQHEDDKLDAHVFSQAAATRNRDVAIEAISEPSAHRDIPDLPKVSLELPPDSGLVLIETARERVAAVESIEPVEQARPRRVRPSRVEAHEEPLQLVETVHKDPAPPSA
jgi:hypothetical protein